MKIGYYIHHEGSGHLQRAKLIAPYFPKGLITYFSSAPGAEALKEFGEVVTLPLDTDEPYAQRMGPRPLHTYLPYYSRGLMERNALMAHWAFENSPLGMHIDVSTEVAEFITLMGLPYTYARQSGNREDRPHQRVYEMAQTLIAPYPVWMEGDDFKNSGHFLKTRYCPVFKSKRAKRSFHNSFRALILKSSTGESSERARTFYREIDLLPKEWDIVAVGSEMWLPANVRSLGWIESVEKEIAQADIVISSAGNNIAQEALSKSTPMVLVPEEKHYQEQFEKAKAIKSSIGCPFVDLSSCAEGELFHLVGEALQNRKTPSLTSGPKRHAEAIIKGLKASSIPQVRSHWEAFV